MRKLLFILILLITLCFTGAALCDEISDGVGPENLSSSVQSSDTANENLPQMQDSITKYESPVTVVVIKDDSELRSFPYSIGNTVLQLFDKGMTLNVTGEYNGFYQVKLARDDYAWIDKDSVLQITGYDNSPANIENFVYEENSKERVYRIKLNKKVPYVLSEAVLYETKQFKSYFEYSDGLDLTVYNVKGYPDEKYEVHINRTGVNDFGYSAYYKSNNELIIKVKNYPAINPQRPFAGLKIALLNGYDTDNSFDKIKTDALIKKLKVSFEKRGADVILSNDVGDADILIGIGLKQVTSTRKFKPNISVNYCMLHSSKLASRIADSLSYQTGIKKKGIKQENLEMLKKTDLPSVLSTIACSDNGKLSDEKFPDTAAKAIIKGIARYLNGK